MQVDVDPMPREVHIIFIKNTNRNPWVSWACMLGLHGFLGWYYSCLFVFDDAPFLLNEQSK